MKRARTPVHIALSPKGMRLLNQCFRSTDATSYSEVIRHALLVYAKSLNLPELSDEPKDASECGKISSKSKVEGRNADLPDGPAKAL